MQVAAKTGLTNEFGNLREKMLISSGEDAYKLLSNPIVYLQC